MRIFLWLCVVLLAGAAAASAFHALPEQVFQLPLLPMAGGVAALLAACLIGTGRSVKQRPVISSASASTPLRPDLQRRATEIEATTDSLQQAAVLSQPATVRIDSTEGRHLEVEQKRLDAGNVEITVTAFGYSGKQYNIRVRGRLDNIRGITWEKPTNLGHGDSERKRQIKGTVSTGSLSEVLASIAKIR